MQTALRLIFWGLVLLLIDVKLDNVDILNDIAGYLVIFAGLRELARVDVAFEYAKPFAAGGAVAAAVITFAGPSNWATDAISALIDGLLVWTICTGIIRIALPAGHAMLAEAARVRRNWNVIAVVIGAAASVIGYYVPMTLPWILIPAIIFGFIIGALVLHLLWRAGDALAQPPLIPRSPAADAVP